MKKKKIKIIARSCFLQGTLLEKKIVLKKFKNFKKPYYKFFNWCDNNNFKYNRVCLNFYKKFNFIDFFVMGINDNSQLVENLGELNRKISKIPNIFKNNNKKLIDPRYWKI